MAKQNWLLKNLGVITLNTIVALAITLAGVTTSSCFKSPVAPIQREIKAYQHTNMAVTAYVPTGKKTATMRPTRVGYDVAVSRDRIDLLGKEVYILCPDKPVGLRYVSDLTHTDIENTIDIQIASKKEALEFGVNQCQVIPLDN